MTVYGVTALIWSVSGFMGGYVARMLMEVWLTSRLIDRETAKVRAENAMVKHVVGVLLVGLVLIGVLLVWRELLRP